jgi:hypothetical protein
MTQLELLGEEQKPQHEVSPGPVSNDELVCRGAFDPRHVKDGKITKAVINNKDLLHGALSVWRLGQGEYGDAPEEEAPTDVYERKLRHIQGILTENTPEGSTLYSILAPEAGQVRSLSLPDVDGRLFAVIDDCVTDKDNGAHPLHCSIKPTEHVPVHNAEDEIFQAAKQQLLRLLLKCDKGLPA